MKIKFIKNTQGFAIGDIIKKAGLASVVYSVSVDELIKNGFAEEIKDDIDIEEIRKTFNFKLSTPSEGFWTSGTKEEMEWFIAYRIVKACIEKLNGDWKFELKEDGDSNFFIDYRLGEGFINDCGASYFQHSIIPYCKNSLVTQKLISLCEPELKVLFNIK